MTASVLNEHTTKSEKISDPDILKATPFDKEFGLFDSVFHEVSDAIAIISTQGNDGLPTFLDINHHFELITGYKFDDIYNRNLYDFLTDNQYTTNRPVIEKALKNRQAAVLSCSLTKNNGEILECDMTLRPYSSNDDHSKFICVLRQTDTKSNSRNQAAKEIKKNLLSAMHHNFKTPLNGILGYSEVIMSEMLGPIEQTSYKEYAQDIHGAGQDLLQLIDNLLELKELETTEFRLHEEEFTATSLMSECLKKIAEEIQAKDITLTSHIDPAISNLYGDKCRLQQVVHSLLTNALKFTLPGGTISLTAYQDIKGCCLIRCEDNGAGMSSQQLAKVFCHDTHLSNIYSSPSVGIGFGLSYVKQLIEKHDGSVSIISSPGKGTAVTLHLPSERLR